MKIYIPFVNYMVFLSKRFFKPRVIFFLFLMIVVAGEALWLMTSSIGARKRPMAEYAARVIEQCAASSYHEGCYDKEIPKLMDAISMEEAFEVTREVQKKDTAYF